jgi:hypothetical protein
MDELNLPGNITFQVVKNQKILEKQISFKSLTKEMNNKPFLNPPSQTDLDSDKVQEMINSYLKKPEYFIGKNKIIIAVLFTDETEKDYILYLVDGQHRLTMAIELYKNHDDSSGFLTLCYIKTYSLKEIEELFNEYNKDSYKNKITFDKDIMKKIKREQLRSDFKKKYSEFFSKTKATANIRYSIDEFLNELDDSGYFSLNLDIEAKNKKFNKIIDYVGYLENYQDYFYKDEINCISNGITFTLKNNNFIEYLMDETIIPDHTFKNPKNRISPGLRINVWKSEFNDDEGICPIYKCKNIICNDAIGFQCGYIISKTNNGQLTLDNLRPICNNCYERMGSNNLETFINICKKEHQNLKLAKKELEK